MNRHGSHLLAVAYDAKSRKLVAETNVIIRVYATTGDEAEEGLKSVLDELKDFFDETVQIEPHESSLWVPSGQNSVAQLTEECVAWVEQFPEDEMWGPGKKRKKEVRRFMFCHRANTVLYQKLTNGEILTKEENALLKACVGDYELGALYLKELEARMKAEEQAEIAQSLKPKVEYSKEDYARINEEFEAWAQYERPQLINGNMVQPPDELLPPEYFGIWADVLWPDQEPRLKNSNAVISDGIKRFLTEYSKAGWDAFGPELGQRNKGWAIKFLQLPEFGGLSENEAKQKVGWIEPEIG